MNRGLCEVTEEATEISGYGTLQVEGTAGAKSPEAHELEKQGGQWFQNGKSEGHSDRK